MTIEKFVNVKRPKTGTGRQCLHCGRPAVVSAVRVLRYQTGTGHRLQVRYCEEHATIRGTGR